MEKRNCGSTPLPELLRTSTVYINKCMKLRTDTGNVYILTRIIDNTLIVEKIAKSSCVTKENIQSLSDAVRECGADSGVIITTDKLSRPIASLAAKCGIEIMEPEEATANISDRGYRIRLEAMPGGLFITGASGTKYWISRIDNGILVRTTTRSLLGSQVLQFKNALDDCGLAGKMVAANASSQAVVMAKKFNILLQLVGRQKRSEFKYNIYKRRGQTSAADC